jgi:hypothetical protein
MTVIGVKYKLHWLCNIRRTWLDKLKIMQSKFLYYFASVDPWSFGSLVSLQTSGDWPASDGVLSYWNAQPGICCTTAESRGAGYSTPISTNCYFFR